MWSYVVHCLRRRFQPIFTEFSPSPPGHGGQDVFLFNCAAPVIRRYRRDPGIYLRHGLHRFVRYTRLQPQDLERPGCAEARKRQPFRVQHLQTQITPRASHSLHPSKYRQHSMNERQVGAVV